jgi:hypothetical protein
VTAPPALPGGARPILDRIPSIPHPRMAQFLARDHVPLTAPPRTSIWWKRGLWLNQANTGHCTAFSITHEAAASPVRVSGLNDSSAHELYYEIKRKGYDPFGLEEGSTVDAAMKVGRDHRWWDTWLWADTAEELWSGLLIGPGIAGTWWKTGMFYPNSDGIIKPTGENEGGHAYCIDGRAVNLGRKGPHYRIEQSWGRDWGLNGRAFLSEDDLLGLIEDGGEFAFPVNRKLLV